MSSESAGPNITRTETGFLERDLRQFFQTGAQQSAGTVGTKKRQAPGKVTKTFEATTTKRKKFFDPSNPEITQTGEFVQTGGPTASLVSFDEDQLSQIVEAFEGRRQQIRQRVRRPGIEQTRLAV